MTMGSICVHDNVYWTRAKHLADDVLDAIPDHAVEATTDARHADSRHRVVDTVAPVNVL